MCQGGGAERAVGGDACGSAVVRAVAAAAAAAATGAQPKRVLLALQTRLQDECEKSLHGGCCRPGCCTDSNASRLQCEDVLPPSRDHAATIAGGGGFAAGGVGLDEGGECFAAGR